LIFFISDLHLSPRSPGATRLFLSFLAGRARQAEALYILGDLFEVWVGDDIDDPYAAQITAALRAASDAGLKICFMHGNRDFAIGEQFTSAAGMSLLPDPYLLVLPEWSFVLSHGDALCIDDHAYMAYRAKVRDPEWQRKMRAKPRFLRSLLGRYIRWRSARRKRSENHIYADLNGAATDDFLREHGYATFIHGHTHRPEKHDHIVDGIHVERWVLSDWHEERAEALLWDGDALRREAITFEN
jgi:UDP-2,3-diacylglucosamine hydrolase